ncbi:hypothetical protein ACIBAC_00650 [Streptomyces sp. NPDC051362]|uniref:hypothetical protein n=1 Tax=Streptomyces sp. NPDC051362 TaxID=3365651 RepID=UPI0037A54520
MQRSRLLAVLARRPRPAVLLAVGLASVAFALGSVTDTYSGQNAGAIIGTPGCSVGIEWHGDRGVFASCTGSDPDAAPEPARTSTVTPQRDASAITR